MPARKPTLNQRFTLVEAERQFVRACDQIVKLDQRIMKIGKRYQRAKSFNSPAFQHDLHMKLAMAKGARQMCFDYAHVKAREAAQLRREMHTMPEGVSE